MASNYRSFSDRLKSLSSGKEEEEKRVSSSSSQPQQKQSGQYKSFGDRLRGVSGNATDSNIVARLVSSGMSPFAVPAIAQKGRVENPTFSDKLGLSFSQNRYSGIVDASKTINAANSKIGSVDTSLDDNDYLSYGRDYPELTQEEQNELTDIQNSLNNTSQRVADKDKEMDPYREIVSSGDLSALTVSQRAYYGKYSKNFEQDFNANSAIMDENTDLEKRRKELVSKASLAKMANDIKGYESVSSLPDFEYKSKQGMAEADEIINDLYKELESAHLIGQSSVWIPDEVLPSTYDVRLYLTDDEKKVWAYHLVTDKKKAKGYIKSLETALTYRRTLDDTLKRKEFYKENKGRAVLDSVTSTIPKIAGAYETVKQNISNTITDDWLPVNIYSNSFIGTRKDQIAREALTEDMSAGGDLVTNALLSAGQNLSLLPVAAIPVVGKAAYSGIMGASAMGDAAYDATKRGASADEALAFGFGVGVIETVTEHIGVDNLFNIAKNGRKTFTNAFRNGFWQGTKTAGKTIGAGGMSEGTEELISHVASTTYDRMIMGDRSEYDLLVRELEASGKTHQQAEAQAFKELYIKGSAEAFAGGFISGGIFGGLAGTFGQSNTKGYGKYGAAAFNSIVLEYSDVAPEELADSFNTAYEAGRLNTPMEKVQLVNDVQWSAFNAGRMDYIVSGPSTQIDQQNLAKNGKVVYNEDNNIEGDVTNGQRKVDNSRRWNGIQKADSGKFVAVGSENLRRTSGNGQTPRVFVYDGRGGADFHVTDSEGRQLKETDAVRLNGTTIVDENGNVLPTYHFTQEMSFEVFAKGDIGHHFGNAQQAAKRQKDLNASIGRTIRAYLSIKNPLRARLDIMNWHVSGTGLLLWSEGVITDAEWGYIKELSAQGEEYDSPASVELRRVLKEKGYDGIVYPNGFEGDGYSYIVFHDSQIVVSDSGRNGEDNVRNRQVNHPFPGLGSIGQVYFEEMYIEGQNVADYASDFAKMYNAGRKGRSYESVSRSVTHLNPAQSRAAYYVGQLDQQNLAKNGNMVHNENSSLEGVNKDERIHLREVGNGNYGTSTGGTLRGVAETSGRIASRDESRSKAESRPADSGATSLTYGEKLTSADLFPTGSASDEVYRVTEGETEHTRKAKEFAEKNGMELVLVKGPLHVLNKNGKYGEARAVIYGDKMVVRVDDAEFTADQIARHEYGHKQIDSGEIDPNTVRERLKTRYTKEELDFIASLYAEAYRETGLSPDEIWYEIICDSLGDMNIFSELSEEFGIEAFLSATKQESLASGETATRIAPSNVVQASHKVSTHIKIGKQTWRQIQEDRMERYGGRFLNMPRVDDFFSADNYFVVENFSEDSFGVIFRINPEKDPEKVNFYRKELKDGDFRNNEGHSTRIELLRRWRDYWNLHSGDVGNTGARTENVGVSSELGRNSIGDRNLGTSSNHSRENREKVDGDSLYSSHDVSEGVERVVERYKGKDLANDASVYTYDFLTSLPDMRGIVLPAVSSVKNAEDEIDRKAVVEEGIKNARSKGMERDGEVFVRNRYTGKPLLVTTSSIRHGLNGDEKRLLTNSRIGSVIGDVVESAVPINALHTKAKGVVGTYAMASFTTDLQGRQIVAIVTVEQKSGNVLGVETFDITHSVSGRQKRGSQADTKSQGFIPIKATTISISDFLEIVKETYQSILSEDVLKHFGEVRNPDGEYTDKVKFSHDVSESVKRIVNEMTPYQIASLTEEDAGTVVSLRDIDASDERGGDSAFYESIQESGWVEGEAKALLASVDDIKYYAPVSDVDLLNQANEELNEGGRSVVEEWREKKAEYATPVDVAKGFILMKRYQDNAKYAESQGDLEQRDFSYQMMATVATKLRQMGTKAGQTVQAFSILGRMTPEGMAVYAQKELSQARDEMIERKSKAWVARHEEMFHLTPEETVFITDCMERAAKLPEGRDKTVLIAQVMATVEAKLPTNVLRTIKAYTRNCMLLNSKTIVRNILGNGIMMPVYAVDDFFASGIDRLLAKQTGVRTKGMTGFRKESLKAAKRGVFESYDDFRKHINTRQASGDRFEVGQGDDFRYYSKAERKDASGIKRAGMGLSNALNYVDRVTSFLLDVGDRPFFEFHFTNSLNNQLRLNQTAVPTAEMIEMATSEALERTWQDDNIVTKSAKRIREGFNLGKEYGIGSIIVPFIKTPANLTRAMVKYSPVGLVDAITRKAKAFSRSKKSGDFDPKTQKAFVDALSKGISGTLLMVVAYALAKCGALSGGEDEDQDLAAFEKNIMGIAPYSVTINGKSYSYDWASPIGGLMAIAADVAKGNMANATQSAFDVITNALATGGNVLFEQSFLQGIAELFSSGEIVSGVINSVTGAVTQFLPSPLAQLANVADPYARTSYVKGSTTQTMTNRVKARIPGMKSKLAPVVDVLGNEVKSYNVFGVFFNPANVYAEKDTAVAREIYRVYEETGELSAIPKVAPYYFNYGGEKFVFTPHERADYQKTSGKTASQTVEKLIKTKGYQALDDNAAAEVLALATSYSEAKAKEKYLSEQGVVYEKQSWMTEAENGAKYGVSVAEYIVAYNAQKDVEGIRDGEGDTITNSKSLRVMEVIYQIPGLTADKRSYLFECFDVGKKVRHYNKARVASELSRMRR